ncbi:sigma-54-dependent Fis family transcriptional regulator [bacterium]|nr:sigma-54-dependent Fis family transcriptional regulator [bacterium]
MKFRILIIDDESSQRELLKGYLSKQGFETETAGSGEKALELFKETVFDLALVDFKLPGMDGISLISEFREIDPYFQAVMLTAYGTVESAVRGMKAGAFDFITKPVNLNELMEIIHKALEHRNLLQENKLLKEQLKSSYPESIVAESPSMRKVLELVTRIAATDVGVLIIGESGTGKDLIARAVHALSHRQEGSFIPINCAAIPENLLESELFGYEKGAFTGAASRKPGKLELASGGTIFLDEIGDMPPGLQAKLLRFLQDGKFFRLGGCSEIQSDARVIAATNQNLELLIREKRFREDLYFRLKVITLEIPPLRVRRQDILPLGELFLQKFRAKHHKEISGFSVDLRKFMLDYSWPGNVRELENAVERAVVLARTSLLQFTDFVFSAVSGSDKAVTLEELESAHIKKILEQVDGHLIEAADLLGIHRNTLRQKIRKYGLDKGGIKRS